MKKKLVCASSLCQSKEFDSFSIDFIREHESELLRFPNRICRLSMNAINRAISRKIFSETIISKTMRSCGVIYYRVLVLFSRIERRKDENKI